MATDIPSALPPKHPIPPDFFTSLQSDAQADQNYALHREKLQTALHLPANHRWVADWMFQDVHNPFHRNIAVPPEAFEKSLPMEVMHHFFDVDMPVCPIMRMRNIQRPKSASHFHSKGADLLLLPVATANGITVGYSFGSVRTAVPSQAHVTAFGGRFVFEAKREELLVISNGDQPGIPDHAEKLMVLMSFMWTPDGAREHYMILCPLRQYSYFNLPNEVLFFTSAEMHVPTKGPIPHDILALQSLFHDNSSPDIIDEIFMTSPTSQLSPQREISPHEDLENLFELPPTSSDLPWFLDSTGHPQDNVGIPRHPGDMPTSSGAFNMDALSASLSAIENSLRGDFYGARQSMELVHPLAQAHPVKTPGMQSARNVVARISRTDRLQTEYLRDFAMRMYLSNVLPVVSDLQFLTQSEQRGLPVDVNPAVMALPQASGARARRIAPLPLGSSSFESEGSGSPADEEERRREEKLEAKRRRNRISAAESNKKRRAKWQMQQQTLGMLRKRVEELEGRKSLLTTENQLLKDRLTAVSE